MHIYQSIEIPFQDAGSGNMGSDVKNKVKTLFLVLLLATQTLISRAETFSLGAEPGEEANGIYESLGPSDQTNQCVVFVEQQALKSVSHFETARPDDDSLENLLDLLAELATGWRQLAQPRIPMSGRFLEDVLLQASQEDCIGAWELISSLLSSPLEDRERSILGWFEGLDPQEIDLWLPFFFAQFQKIHNAEEAARTCTVALRLAATAGRRDILLFGAGMAFDIVQMRLAPEAVNRVLNAWMGLLPAAGAERGTAILHSSYAGILSQLGDHSGALDALHAARDLFQTIGDTGGSANSWLDEADILYFLGDYEGALTAYRTARDLYQAIDSLLGEGNTWDGEAHLLSLWGNKMGALTGYRTARELFRRFGDPRSVGNTWCSEADVLSYLGDHEGALAAYRAARELFQSVGSLLDEGITWNGEADVLFHLGDYEGALAAYRTAKSGFQTVGDPFGLANSILGEAGVFSHFGDYEGALAAYRSARRLFIAADDSLGRGNSWHGEANVLFLLGENWSALNAFWSARRFYQAAGEPVGRGNTWRGEADLLLRVGLLEDALLAYRTARDLFQTAGASLGEGATFRGEAEVLSLWGDPKGALTAYQASRDLCRAAGSLLCEGNALLGEAELRLGTGGFAGAARAAANANEIFQQIEAVPNQVNALIAEGKARRHLGEHERVAQLAERAIFLYSGWRQSYVAEEHRTGVDNTIAHAYELLLPLLDRRGSLDEMLTYAEGARSRVLLDLLTTDGPAGAEEPLDLRIENRNLRTQLARLSAELAQASTPEYRAELLFMRQALDHNLQNNLYRRVAGAGEQKFGEPLDAQGIRALAREIGPLMLFQAMDGEVLVLVVLSSGETIPHFIDLPRSELNDMVEEFVFDLSNPLLEHRAAKRAEDLWRLMLAPLVAHLPSTGPLTLVPHGPLHGLPFEALLDPVSARRLFEIWDVTMSPSLSALDVARRKRHRLPTPGDDLVAFASGVGLSLPEEDIRLVAEYFPAAQRQIFGPAEVSIQVYEEHAAKARHLLIASRGVHVQESRRGTYLEIKPTPDVHDERLTAAEIAGIPLQAELVTLAACDTDRGDALLSDERLTLTRSFLIAGAASVLATRWRVPEDRSTTRFLADFYGAYRKGPDGKGLRKDQALTWARRQAVRRGDLAQGWAAWVLVGDAR